MDQEDWGADVDGELVALARRWLGGGHAPKSRFQELLDQGADPAPWIDGEPLLELAAASGLAEAPWLCRALAAHGAPLGAALERACAEGDAETVDVLLDAGARAWDGAAPALERADPDILGALLARGADGARLLGPGGEAALSFLAESSAPGAVECARLLLDAGADPDEPDGAGWPPLARSAAGGRRAMARLLLSRGADPRAHAPGDFSALSLALGARAVGAGLATPQSVGCALDLGAALGPGWGSAVDARAQTPLARLCLSAGFVEPWMEALVQAGADPLARGEGGLLETACLLGEADGLALARWALSRGVDPGRACARSVLPERLALRRERFELSELLRSARESAELDGESAQGSGSGNGSRL